MGLVAVGALLWFVTTAAVFLQLSHTEGALQRLAAKVELLATRNPPSSIAITTGTNEAGKPLFDSEPLFKAFTLDSQSERERRVEGRQPLLDAAAHYGTDLDLERMD